MASKPSSNRKDSIEKYPLLGEKFMERLLSGVIAHKHDKFIKKLENILTRNLDKTNHPSNCWIYSGSKDKDGYGRIALPEGRDIVRPNVKMPPNIKAHRLAFALWRYDFENELTIEHDCRTRSCVNPNHLYPCTHKQNINERDKKRRLHYEKSLVPEPLTLPNAAEQLDKLLLNIKRDVGALDTYRRIVQNALNQCERAMIEFDTEDNNEVS